jgi:glycine dehydrogenase subunit 2
MDHNINTFDTPKNQGLIFEKSVEGRGVEILPPSDVSNYKLPEKMQRKKELHLPCLAETDISRHYTELASRIYGINNGFYPLGSCTMKYNPKLNEEMAKLPGFTEIHPLQPNHTVRGCLEVMKLAETYLCEVTGMDAMSFQPAAGAHGEFVGLQMIRAYHRKRNDLKRNTIIVPDSAHGTNPASAAMAGFTVVNIPSTKEGFVDLEELKSVVGEDTAGFMLTNPNTLGLFDKNILEITDIIHKAGGLTYYDGANLNAIMGYARPGDMGFDVIHLNLHKTFSTPHGGGGPGGGPVGCKEFLNQYLPLPRVVEEDGVLFLYPVDSNDSKQAIRDMRPGKEMGNELENDMEYSIKNEIGNNIETIIKNDIGINIENKNGNEFTDYSIGRSKEFYGHFLVVVRALTYILTLGGDGLKDASSNAVLNANYMMSQLIDIFDMPFEGPCMHEFVFSTQKLKKEKGVSALDFAKTILDYGIHPPTMYFPLIIHEALMVEPTETESKQTMDRVIRIFKDVYNEALNHPEDLHNTPQKTPISRPDDTTAARNPVLRYEFT